MKKLSIIIIATLVTAASAMAQKVNYLQITKPFKNDPVFKTPMQPVRSGALLMPYITWAPDGVTIHANGGENPNPASKLSRAAGVPVKLERQDDFNQQIANYIAGKSPFLRGTMGMINLAAEGLTAINPDLEPMVIVQLSWSTGADGFVAKGVNQLADLKGKTIVVQRNGPHMDLVFVLIQDAGLKPSDVNVKYVADITLNPDNKTPGINDPAGAFRGDNTVDGAAAIYPDILTLTAGGNVGTGAEDSVRGARPILTTRTASRVIADVYAVRRDWFLANQAKVNAIAKAILDEQAIFSDYLDNIAKKKSGDQLKTRQFKNLCKPLSGIFLFDEAAVDDYILWLGIDSLLAGHGGNKEFFTKKGNPVGFAATNQRIQGFYVDAGFLSTSKTLAPPTLAYLQGASQATTTVSKPAFSSAQAVRAAAESADAGTLFSYSFQFPATMADLKWNDYQDVFHTIHEKVSRYGGAVVQLRGHADNFFYNFVSMKRAKGDTTYKRRVNGAFQTFPLPQAEEILNSANKLSYSRAFSVKRAYAQYLREFHNISSQEMDLSRFDVKGVGVGDPVHRNPKSPQERMANMRGEVIIIGVESELPLEFGMDDLQ